MIVSGAILLAGVAIIGVIGWVIWSLIQWIFRGKQGASK